MEPPAVGMPTVFYPGPSRGNDGDKEGVLLVLLAIVVVLIIVILYHALSPRNPARDLARSGWTVYLLRGCGYCDKQMKLLSGFSRFVLYGPQGAVLGGYTTSPPVSFATIKGFPHWYNLHTGESRSGLQDSAALKKMAGQR